jgi:site-specific DNA recombinase
MPVIFASCLSSDISDRKAFLKTFVKRIEIDGNSATVKYKLPMGPGSNGKDDASVLPNDIFGGAEGIRTPYLLNAIQSLSQLSYSPKDSC